MSTDLLGRWSLILVAAILFMLLIAGCMAPPQGPPLTPTQVATAPTSAVTTSATTVMTTAPMPKVTTTNANQTNVSPVFTITIQNSAFNPQTATISVGTTVTWTNQGSTPTQIINGPNVIFDQEQMFDSGPLGMGQSFSFTFNTTGTFLYLDTLHPAVTGKIIVT